MSWSQDVLYLEHSLQAKFTSHTCTGAVAKAIKSRSDLHFGVYFSQYEWYHPLYLQDKNNSYKTQYYVKVTH